MSSDWVIDEINDWLIEILIENYITLFWRMEWINGWIYK